MKTLEVVNNFQTDNKQEKGHWRGSKFVAWTIIWIDFSIKLKRHGDHEWQKDAEKKTQATCYTKVGNIIKVQGTTEESYK
jgi:hypothetical protein